MNNRDQNASSAGAQGLRSSARNTMLVSPGNAEFKLVRINDGFAGESFPLVEHINTIGRIDENTILLSHKSISRNHAQIIRDGSLHRLVDLDSSNGTFYNGKRVHRSYPVNLTEGGIVQFGSIEFVFIDVNKVIDPKSYAQTSTKWLVFTGMAILFLLIVAGASIAFTLYQSEKTEPAKEDASQTLEAKAQKLIELGQKQVDLGDWSGAAKTFETISTILPNHPDAARLRQRAQLELEAEQTYEKAGAALEGGDLIQARSLLQGIQPGTEAKRRAENQIPRIEEKMAARMISEAETLMGYDSSEDLEKAYDLLVEAARLEPAPKRRVRRAADHLAKLYKSKKMKFEPLELDEKK